VAVRVIRGELQRIENETLHPITERHTERDDWIGRGSHLHDLLNGWGRITSERPPPDIPLEFEEEPIRANLTVVKTWLSKEYEAVMKAI
jgi:hypothetical protein